MYMKWCEIQQITSVTQTEEQAQIQSVQSSINDCILSQAYTFSVSCRFNKYIIF